jgi:hypothetical protein
MSLVNGTPLIPLGREGNWLLVAAACDLTPTFAWSWTAGVPLNRCWVSIGRNALLNALEHALESWNVAVIWSGARMRRAVFATSVPIFPSSLAAPENMSSYSLPIVFFGTSFPSDSHIDRLSVCKVRESAVPKQRLERQYPGQAAQLRALPSGYDRILRCGYKLVHAIVMAAPGLKSIP